MSQMEMFNGEPVTDGINAGIEIRKQRGLEIAALARIDRDNDVFIVPSQTDPRHPKYKVRYHAENPTCTCPDHEQRGCRCKHIYAVEYVIRREQSADGSQTITETLTVTTERKTYAQDWPNYNAAQTNEKRHFQELLADLCKTVEQPAQDMSKGGRPRLALSDAIFSAVFKIYCTLSARRFACDLSDAVEKGYITKAPHFNSVLKALENPELFSILTAMIEQTGLPLKSVESQFAVDSTGFAYSRFVRWFDIKYNRFTAEQQWIKAHICTGTKTNIVTAIEIHGRDAADSHHLPALVQKTSQQFDVKEVSADKGYSDRRCHDAIAAIGAEPFIMFKHHSTGAAGGMFKKMFHFFQFKRDEFLQHYHRRSNVESTIMMIKTKFGDAVRSKTEVAARNEVLAKVLAHNICCLIHAMYELGIQPMLSAVPCTQTPQTAHIPTLF